MYNELLQKYGYIEEPLVGTNANGENVIISIDKEREKHDKKNN